MQLAEDSPSSTTPGLPRNHQLVSVGTKAIHFTSQAYNFANIKLIGAAVKLPKEFYKKIGSLGGKASINSPRRHVLTPQDNSLGGKKSKRLRVEQISPRDFDPVATKQVDSITKRQEI